MEISGHRSLVTGAAAVICAAVAEDLAAAGAHVICVDVDLEGAKNTASSISGTAVGVDLSDPAAISAMYAELSEAPRIIVNCAGRNIAEKTATPDAIHDPSRFAAIISLNLTGTFLVAAHGAHHMMALEPVNADGLRGVIINTASVAGYEGREGQAAYASSKAGVIGLTLPMARDLGRYGIRVVALAPGPTDTPMIAGLQGLARDTMANDTPFPKRFAKPQEYAAMVRAAIGADFLNGTTVRLDGGLRMHASNPAFAADDP